MPYYASIVMSTLLASMNSSFSSRFAFVAAMLVDIKTPLTFLSLSVRIRVAIVTSFTSTTILLI